MTHQDNYPKKLLTIVKSPKIICSKENLNPKNEFSDFERWSKSTDKIGNKSGTFINTEW